MNYSSKCLLIGLISTFIPSAHGQLRVESFDVSDAIIVAGDLGTISDRRPKSVISDSDSLLNVLSLVVPPSWTVEIDESLIDRSVSVDSSDVWVQLLEEILLSSGLRAKMDIDSKYIYIGI